VKVVVVGAGLTGLAAAHSLVAEGHSVTVYERSFLVGGHARSEWLSGVPYEPHGAHILHTNDAEVWRLITSLVEVLPYRHRVMTALRGEMLSWPLQLTEIRELPEWSRVERQLSDRPNKPDARNLETWCVSLMGATLFELFVADYTAKQWGRPARELSAGIGPKRVELRSDGERDLFRDRHQGWPRDGYGALAEALAADLDIVFGEDVTIEDVPFIAAPRTPIIVTSALDDFFASRFGPLEWRGVRLVGRWLPDWSGMAQPAMVVNRPEPEVAYTRTIETKWVLGDAAPRRGTMVMYEYPGAPAKHYPVPDADGVNARAQARYADALRRYQRNPLIPAGRLAGFTYINMDEAMRAGLGAAADAITWRR
jgi:UDP-galactopyranose mutase